MHTLPVYRSSALGVCAVALAALALVTCSESPFAPKGEGERVPFGLVIEGEVSAGNPERTYSFDADSGRSYSVAVEVTQGSAMVFVRDVTHQLNSGDLAVFQGDPPLPRNGIGVTATGRGVFVVDVSRTPSDTLARFRLQIAPVGAGPESAPQDVQPGDTVTAETLLPAGDVDLFRIRGTPGGQVVAVVEALGDPASGLLDFAMTSTRSGPIVRTFDAVPGVAAAATSGRLAFPASGELWLGFHGSAWIRPLFSGAYRFWTWAVDPAPERRAAAIQQATVVNGESIAPSGDVDEFQVPLAAGAEVALFLQAPRTFRLDLVSPADSVVASVTDTAPADTALFSSFSGRTRVGAAGTYRARVSGEDLLADTGAYRLFVYPIDRRPEHVGQSIAAGDTVTGESIDLPGDIDEFTFYAPAGAEFDAFVQAQDGSLRTRLTLEAVDAGGTVLRSATSAGNDSTLVQQLTGRFAARTSGTHHLRVAAAPCFGCDGSTGPYRLLLYSVDLRPETHDTTLALGDSVLNESIDFPGDVDQFRVVVPDSSGASVVLEWPGPPVADGSGLMARLVGGPAGATVAQTTRYGTGLALSGTTVLAPGRYTLRVEAVQNDDRPVLAGPYRLWMYRFRTGPEVAGDTITIGDTVATEAIDPLGDVDRFVFYGRRRQLFNLAFQGRGAPAVEGALQAFLSGTADAPQPIVAVSSPVYLDSLGARQTGRWELPYTGWYQLTVRGAGTGDALSERGPYRLALTPLSSSPESVGAALLPGDSVAAEALDFPGDVDEFHAAAAPGSELYVVFSAPVPPQGASFPSVRLVDPASGDELGGNIAQGLRIAGPVRVPAGGDVAVDVLEPYSAGFRVCITSNCAGFSLVGPYALRVMQLQRAPESVAANVAVGDTVRGEALDPVGDFDEFTVTGTPGDTLSAWLRLTADPGPPGSYQGTNGPMITIEIVDPSTGAVVSGGTSLTASMPQFVSPGAFLVPASGVFLVRIRGTGGYGEDLGTGPYEFVVRRGS